MGLVNTTLLAYSVLAAFRSWASARRVVLAGRLGADDPGGKEGR